LSRVEIADVQQPPDMRRGEAHEHPGLPGEPGQHLLLGAPLRSQELDRRVLAVQTVGLVDDADDPLSQLAAHAPAAAHDGAGADDRFRRRRRRAGQVQIPPKPQLAGDLLGQAPQRLELALAQRAGRAIGDRERPDGRTFVDLQRHPRVEPDAGVARDQRVVCEAGIAQRVLDDQRLMAVDTVSAERQIPGNPGQRHPDPRLEPLVVGVDQRDEGDLGPAQIRRQPGHVVERLLRRGVDDPAGSQQRQSPLFVHWNRRFQHP
jgi:hypothetical protein